MSETDPKHSYILKKCATDIKGLDELTNGGLPLNRTTLITGGAGCGKTVFGMEFLINGIKMNNEPCVFMSFEEDIESLNTNFASFGYNLYDFIDENMLHIDYVDMMSTPIIETGKFSLEPLFLRLEYAINKVGAKRLVLDTIESIFTSLSDKSFARIEMKRLFLWLRDKNVTSIVTSELGNNVLTEFNLEQYVSDCVITLDHRVVGQISKRRLRILKYRGSSHISDECPFLITNNGVKVLPITSLTLNHSSLNEHISSGIPDLDKMMNNKGYYKASSILVSGTSGTGKSTFAASFANSVCSRNEKCLYFSFEESMQQIIRNMNSVGNDLKPFVENETLQIISERSSNFGLEEHLTKILNKIDLIRPSVVIIDPVSNFFMVGAQLEIKSMLTRLVDYLKMLEITGFFVSLADPDSSSEQTKTAISSVMDTWLVLSDYLHENRKRRLFYLLKARGMKHSQDIREMIMSNEGISFKDPDFSITDFGKYAY